MDEKISNEQIGRLVDICNQDTPVEAFILAFRWTFPQIASELLAVRQRIAKLEEANRWIPVSEKLPCTDDEILIACRGGEVVYGYYSHRYKTWHYDDGVSVRSDVTHWKNKPEPAKEE